MDLGDFQNLQGCWSLGPPSETVQLPVSGTPARRLGLTRRVRPPLGAQQQNHAEPTSAPRIAPACAAPALGLPVGWWASQRLGEGLTCAAELPAWLEVANLFGKAAPGRSQELIPGNR